MKGQFSARITWQSPLDTNWLDEIAEQLVNEAAWQFLATHPVDTATDSDMQLRQICLNHLSHEPVQVFDAVIPDIKLSAEFYKSLSQPED